MIDKFAGVNDDVRLYIIGDIHGRSDLLDRIVDEIYRDRNLLSSGQSQERRSVRHSTEVACPLAIFIARAFNRQKCCPLIRA